MRKLTKTLSCTIQLLTGTALTAAAFGMMILPQGFAAAGVTGFSKILTVLLPLPLPLTVFACNLLLLFLGLVFVGKRFAAKTVAVSLLFPAMLEIFSRYPLSAFDGNPLLCAIAAGVTLGAGSGMILRSGASSGGFDILAVILNRKLSVSVAVVMNLCDGAVILMQALRQPPASTVYGILVITVSAAVVNRMVRSAAPSPRFPTGPKPSTGNA